MEYNEKYLEMLDELLVYKSLLKRNIPKDMMFLDGEIVDKKTFETVRKATSEEVESFYNIRILKLRLREMVR